MSDFKWRHFQGEVILWAVRWYCRYGVSYRDLEHMMGERGVPVDHSTIYRWVQRYATEIEKRLRWHWRRPRSTSWRVDETYVKVRGQWTYLYRAVDNRQHDRFLSVPDSQCQSRQALSRQGVESPEGLGTANRHQHRQGSDLWHCHCPIEGRRQMSRRPCAPAGQISEQRR